MGEMCEGLPGVPWPAGQAPEKWKVEKMATSKELISLHSLAYTEDGETVWLTYKLLGGNGRYGVLCYREGVAGGRPRSAAVEDLFASREQAESVLRLLAGRRVAPAHLEDVLWEL